MSKSIEIKVNATQYEDRDDCPAAAQEDARERYGLDGYDLDPRWDDDDLRECIVLTVPEWAVGDAPAAPGGTWAVCHGGSLRGTGRWSDGHPTKAEAVASARECRQVVGGEPVIVFDPTVEGAMYGCTAEAAADAAADACLIELGYGLNSQPDAHNVEFSIAYDGHPDVSDAQIEALRLEAGAHGDDQTHADCQLVLGLNGDGDVAAARMRCEATILEARERAAEDAR